MVVQAADRKPQSSRHSNTRVLNQIKKALWDFEPIRSSGSIIEVEVADSAVRLFGRVRALALKQIAGYLVQRLADGREVANMLVSDSELIQDVANALARDPLTRPHVIRVEARLGQVTLLGVIPSVEVEQRALEVAAASPLADAAISKLEIDAAMASEAPTTPPPAQVEARPVVEVGSAE